MNSFLSYTNVPRVDEQAAAVSRHMCLVQSAYKSPAKRKTPDLLEGAAVVSDSSCLER